MEQQESLLAVRSHWPLGTAFLSPLKINVKFLIVEGPHLNPALSWGTEAHGHLLRGWEQGWEQQSLSSWTTVMKFAASSFNYTS